MEYNEETIRIRSIEDLKLLDIQEVATIISLISDMLSYQTVLQSKQLIYIKYNTGEDVVEPTPDKKALQSVYLYIIAKVLYTQVGFIRYDNLYQRSMEGEFNYSLEPNVDVNIGNILSLLGLMYTFAGAKEFVIRDTNLPVFGIR